MDRLVLDGFQPHLDHVKPAQVRFEVHDGFVDQQDLRHFGLRIKSIALGGGIVQLLIQPRALGLDDTPWVRFAGHQPDPAPYYRAMDAFVISSDTEQMPVALLEAMASALPVVSTEVGDVRSMLPEAQGPFVVPLAERESAWPLAEKLTAMLADAPLRAELGAANRARVAERYTFERMLAAYREEYERALGR